VVAAAESVVIERVKRIKKIKTKRPRENKTLKDKALTILRVVSSPLSTSPAELRKVRYRCSMMLMMNLSRGLFWTITLFVTE